MQRDVDKAIISRCSYGGLSFCWWINTRSRLTEPSRPKLFRFTGEGNDYIGSTTDAGMSFQHWLWKSYGILNGLTDCEITEATALWVQLQMSQLGGYEHHSSIDRRSLKQWSSDRILYYNSEWEELPPKVLKRIAGMIQDSHYQLSRLASDWTTELDRCEGRKSSICAHTMAYDADDLVYLWSGI